MGQPSVEQDRIVQVDGVPICLETFGDPTDPPVLLIAGITSSMDWWPPQFCARLAAGSRYVVRYDQRDTRSFGSITQEVNPAIPAATSSPTPSAFSMCWTCPGRTLSAYPRAGRSPRCSHLITRTGC